MVTPSEGWWVLKAQAGDGEALDRLLRGIYPSLLRFVTRMVGERAAAEDVLQDTMLIVARKLRWLDSPGAFRPWAYRIASRTAMKALRRERRRFQLIDRDADVEAAQAVIAEPPDDLEGRLPDLIASVSPASRAVLILHFMEGLPLQAVSDILEIPLGTVKSRLAYGLRLLRERADA
jgi:RNA polymerase sigma-70 factor (ECF subfamily)